MLALFEGVFIEELLDKGRHVGSTESNAQSSRSHAVFTINITSKMNVEGVCKTKFSRLHLIDLAGSERQKETKAAGVRLKEASSINKALLTLGNVIRSLSDVAQGKERYISYRNSKLTLLLKVGFH
jgi:kinesin family protein 15